MINNFIINSLSSLNIPITFQKYSGTASKYITFFTYLNQGEDFSEDEEESTGHYIQLDIWYKTDIGDLAQQIVNLLKIQGFKKLDIRDMPYEADTGIYHTVVSLFYLEENI
ncbi:hypothetical protein CPAST_c34690 [Clostridium pasteurianum DSM 525 = ATCC 6013]|uniref:Uncharacterized protein n=1 Tax=Clostridium pasteurianum DSM 525 = ATCC 6013 TaxID=1262449 RepID=A0A0H3JBD3_CLOPA|nr:hypothetical protein [Clostridium pasteurianum]AJA49530.1 hypothetical protein CPAST_c34690 [Clostridium pasteurianum DSM 525 = ATCC 6013]AJA53518.1 hypothetical protein CLPA_c34690 [Clostridium pasteurianum DSM 525 = ATCC 6013]AOZ76689.1 hypothetical protein AQ983_16850 [Clostridium pasteurianum DSM 525 = ATCC 6013]AOZ80486.1 hypothetical protein AQ984_16845 [Clostridium pasteurianum]ELP58952.1 hypothetical protein F502_12526 [Clostridium pasteurianum DSM 525 = ATCC 6013]